MADDMASPKATDEKKSESKSAVGHDDMLSEMPLDDNILFERFASMLPTGLAILNHKAEAVFVNPQFHELTVHKDHDKSFTAWPRTIHPEDYDRVMESYKEAFARQESLRVEFRARAEGTPWRLLLLTPLKGENLQHAELREYGGFICAVIDITDNKRAELNQKQAVKEAQERKVQQERFIDMISHEIRNPLSAVLHCSEDILDAINALGADVDAKVKADIVEAAETIKLCVAHQKNIVDDVLAFSKLDASMLSLTPKAVQPKRQLANTLKIFQPELRKHSIEFAFKIDVSYERMKVDWISADLIRMSQVLINLMTNSIKFTADKKGRREITVGLGASNTRPTSYPPNVVFFGTEESELDIDGTKGTEWGEGERLYIMVAVSDTGIGISDELQKRLFERFRQATPRTEHVYGGSGLGLNISRKLCHLHGGEIGVSSKEGEGSTFGFFFKARRSSFEKGEDEPAPHDVLQNADLDYQLRRLGNIPDGQTTLSSMPDSLLHPKVEHVKEVSEGASQTKMMAHSEAISKEVPHEKQTSKDSRSADKDDTSKDSRARNKDDTPKDSHSDNIQANSKHSDVTSPHATKIHILLAEDNVINAKILRRKLEAQDFSVVCVTNGREAVEAYKSSLTSSTSSTSPFDVVLMDQEMPVMSGNTASGEIRKLEQEAKQDAHVPILGVSANVRTEQKDDMVSAGMDDVIGKPYAFQDMLSKIKEMLADHATAAAASSAST